MVDVKDSGLPANQALADADIVALTQNVAAVLTTTQATLDELSAHVLNGAHPLTGNWTAGAFNVRIGAGTPAHRLDVVDSGTTFPIGFYESGGTLQGELVIGSAVSRQWGFNAVGASLLGDNWIMFRFGSASRKVFVGHDGTDTRLQGRGRLCIGFEPVGVGGTPTTAFADIAAFSGTAGATPTANEINLQVGLTWAPTSTAFTYTSLGITPTINQTGTSTGTYKALNISVTETAIVGTAHSLITAAIVGASYTAFDLRRDGQLTVAPDQDVTTTLGRARIGSPTSDVAFFAHVDMLSTTQYALRAASTGSTRVNGASSVSIAAADSSRFSLDSNSINIGAGLTDIGGTLNVQALAAVDHSILVRGIASQTGAFFRAETVTSGARVWDVVPLAGATPIANETCMTLSSTWVPTSTAFTFTQLSLTPTINQTGTSTGTYTALYVNVTETAIVGTAHYLMSLNIAGNPRMRVKRDGTIRNELDNGGFYTGAGDDLRAYHDGTNSIIANVTGLMRITSTNSGLTIPVHAADPASLEDGAIWYDSVTDKLMVRANGVSVAVH